MKKSKNNKKDLETFNQPAPRSFRKVSQLQKHLSEKTHIKPVKAQKKNAAEIDDEIRKSVNLIHKKNTKKYQKRKEYLSSKKKKPVVEEEKDFKKDFVKFNDIVDQPPTITSVPKDKTKPKDLSIERQRMIQFYRLNKQKI